MDVPPKISHVISRKRSAEPNSIYGLPAAKLQNMFTISIVKNERTEHIASQEKYCNVKCSS